MTNNLSIITNQPKLDIPDNITKDDWLEYGNRLSQVVEHLNWYVGDWLAFGEKNFGVKTTIPEAMGILKWGYDRLVACKFTSSCFPDLLTRVSKLSWTHYRQVATYQKRLAEIGKNPIDYINLAESKELSTRALDRIIQDDLERLLPEPRQDEMPIMPAVEMPPDDYEPEESPKKPRKKPDAFYYTLADFHKLPEPMQDILCDPERWELLPESIQDRLKKNKTFNKQDGDSIEWAQYSWNPVTGCRNDCSYCYARDIATRFYSQDFEPSFYPDRLLMPQNTKVPTSPRWDGDIGYKNVFTVSMGDLFGHWMPDSLIETVLNRIKDAPQWNFLLLTKFPHHMAKFNYPDNVWLGTTVDYQYIASRAKKAFTEIRENGFNGVCFLSCEPMMERLTFDSLSMFDLVIMGGSSKSTQTPEYKPPFDDIVHLYNQARQADCKVYFKTNLIPNMSNEQRVREYPIRG